MFPFGSLGAYQLTVKEVEFAEVTVSKHTSEGATNTQNISCCYLTQWFGQQHTYNSASYLTLQCSCKT
jgi:hypothetical protein